MLICHRATDAASCIDNRSVMLEKCYRSSPVDVQVSIWLPFEDCGKLSSSSWVAGRVSCDLTYTRNHRIALLVLPDLVG